MYLVYVLWSERVVSWWMLNANWTLPYRNNNTEPLLVNTHQTNTDWRHMQGTIPSSNSELNNWFNVQAWIEFARMTFETRETV